MMRWLIPIAREVLGLFVEDGRFALAILVWLAAVAFLPPLIPLGSQWRGPMLFAGLAIILFWSCVRHVAPRAA